MATPRVEIPAEELYPGDLVDVEYSVRPGANETLLGVAVKGVKESLWADERFVYQGSRWEERTDPDTGILQRYLIITVSVRDPAKRGGYVPPPPEQHAGVATIAMLVALVAAVAVIASAGALTYRSYVIHRMSVDTSLSEAERIAALNALGQGQSGLGTGLVTAALIIGALWLLSVTGRGESG